jgi:peptidoglycan-N-acetylglucosamine deacetylase
MMINEASTSEKLIAITFDDGPNPIYTPQILDIFSEVNGKATFFMIGEQIERFPEIAKKALELGHEIGNHTFTHPKLSQLSREECFEEIKQTETLIKELVGGKSVVFRPPYLDFNDEIVSVLSQMGYPMIGAINMEAKDWEMPGVEFILEKTRYCVKDGSILIFHDGYGDRSQTVEAVRTLVSELTSLGYKLVTVSELLNHSQAE